MKIGMVYSIFGVMSVRVPKALFFGALIFALQVFLLGKYFLYEEKEQSDIVSMVQNFDKKTTEWNHVDKKTKYHRIWLFTSILFLTIELILILLS